MIPQWQSVGFIGGSGGHFANYEDGELGVSMVVFTPCNRASGTLGKSRLRYCINGDRRVFLTEDELIDALEARSRSSGLPLFKPGESCQHCGQPLNLPRGSSVVNGIDE